MIIGMLPESTLFGNTPIVLTLLQCIIMLLWQRFCFLSIFQCPERPTSPLYLPPFPPFSTPSCVMTGRTSCLSTPADGLTSTTATMVAKEGRRRCRCWACRCSSVGSVSPSTTRWCVTDVTTALTAVTRWGACPRASIC